MTSPTEVPGQIAAICAAASGGDMGLAASLYQSFDLDPDAARSLFGQLSGPDGSALLEALPDDAKAREVLLWVPLDMAASIVSGISPVVAARLIAGMTSDKRADLLAALPDHDRSVIQSALPFETQADLSRLLKYQPGTAGGLMETEFLAYPANATVREAIRDLRANQQKYASLGIQYLYLIDEARRLLGVAPVRDLMLAPEDAALISLVRSAPATVRDDADTHSLASAFEEHAFMALPVVDERGVLVGVVNRAAATEREHEEAEDDYRVSQGIVGGEELRSMPIATRLRRRGAWLGVNLVLCLGGAAVIGAHQETIAKVIAVAAVLPVISATSGNAAMQAAAVSIRELTLGVIDAGGRGRGEWRGEWGRVLKHELALAALLALPLGAAVGLLARLWGADWMIGAAVGVAMAANALIAIAIGGLCPLLLRRLRMDPALASGPLTTTLADVSGFAITLTLVAAMA